MTDAQQAGPPQGLDDEIERLLAEPDQIPLDSVPYGLLNRVSGALSVKNQEIERLRDDMEKLREGIEEVVNLPGLDVRPWGLLRALLEKSDSARIPEGSEND